MPILEPIILSSAAHTLWYQDPAIWSSIAAWVGATLSIILAVKPWFQRFFLKPKLTVDFFERAVLNHTVGYSTCTIYVNLRNLGGKATRIQRLYLRFTRDQGAPILLDGMDYFVDPSATSAVILAPFTIEPNEEWSHAMLFSKKLSRADEQALRGASGELRQDIIALRAGLPPNAPAVEADEGIVTRLIQMFNAHFEWLAGEYTAEFLVSADDEPMRVLTELRLAVFDSDEAALRSYTEHYKFGLGVSHFDIRQQPGATIRISLTV